MRKKTKTEYPMSNVQYPISKGEKIPMVQEGDYNLENRLIDFAVRIIRLTEALPSTKAGTHVAGQILRIGTSPAPNYGEAQGAESRDDFIHKVKVALKEMRETHIWLKIIAKANLIKPAKQLEPLLQETDELVAILFASAQTARKRAGATP